MVPHLCLIGMTFIDVMDRQHVEDPLSVDIYIQFFYQDKKLFCLLVYQLIWFLVAYPNAIRKKVLWYVLLGLGSDSAKFFTAPLLSHILWSFKSNNSVKVFILNCK